MTDRRHQPGWAALAGAAGLAAALPLWSSRFLPFQDAPQHLAAVRVIADYGDPFFGFQRFFEIDLGRWQYLGFYLPAALFAKAVGPDAAVRLVLTLVALALPAAAWMLLGAFGRDRRLAVFAPAVFHTAPLYLGFFNFVSSVPATLAVVALAERELRAPSTRRAVLAALAALVLFSLHPSALALALGAAAVLAASAELPLSRRLRGLLPFLPAALLFVGWTGLDLLSQRGAGAGAGGGGVVFPPLREKALDVLRLGNVLAGHADEAFALALGAIWLAAVLVSARGPREARAFRLPLLAGATFAAYLATPAAVGFAGFIHLRALPFLAAVALLSPVLAEGRATNLLCGAAVALQVAYAGTLVTVYRAFDREAEAAQLEQVLAAAAPARRLLALIPEKRSSIVQFAAYTHFGLYYQLARGGRARLNFAEYPWTPVRFRSDPAPPPLRRSWEASPELFDASRDGADADYLLVRGPGPDPGPPFALERRAGRWLLYARAPR
ncbi:MAG: hypothetical protein NVSMB23_03310 [Myxococcales bacterium]